MTWLSLLPVAQKKKAMIGMTAMSLMGDTKVSVMTVKAMPPFCMAVSRDMAII